MLSSLSLNGVWKVRGFDGQHGRCEHYIGDDADERTFIDAHVPGEIHLDLEREGWIQDCNVGLNAQAARWVEEQVWVYRTRFAAPGESLSQRAWLVFEGLDLCSVIYLNGQEVGRHDNCFTPCRIDVTGRLREGENCLAVQIESGLYYVAEKCGDGYVNGLDNQLTKRCWLRKPQYSFSWDWSPRLINVGIWRSVRLEWTSAPRIDAVAVYPELSDDHSTARINARVFVDNIHPEPVKATVRMTVTEPGDVVAAPQRRASAEVELELPAGISRQDISVEIADPKLWWPIPHGDQPLYTVEIEALVDGEVVDKATRRTGIRSIRINTDPHPEVGDYFILEVNGRPIFAKGGNWVPPDMIYARTDADHYRKLVRLAVEANFNALRVWGGGLYADHAFLDACDEAGVLVWHDFIFACAKYPSDNAEFLMNVRREITHQVRDLSPHPSLLVWCGNNELEWAAWAWGYERNRPHPDYALYHLEIPRIVKTEDPSRPYWPSSPYSTDSRHPQDKTTGDQHPWHVSLGEGKGDFWEYRKDVSRFPNEGGVLGATSMATLKQFLPEGQRRVFSPVWEFHDNACNYWGQPGVAYDAIERWTGRKPEEFEFEDYCFYSGVVQAEGLQEYINNFRRRMFSSSSAIFWMYNDSWPVSHGWTIVDYYLRRKLAYHPVRRAFAPVHVIPVAGEDAVTIYGVNDTPEPWVGEVRYGLFRLDGRNPSPALPATGREHAGEPSEALPPHGGEPDQILPPRVGESTQAPPPRGGDGRGGVSLCYEQHITLPPNASTVIGEIPMEQWTALGPDASGAFALLLKDGRTVAQNRVFVTRFKDLKFAEPQIKIERRGDRAVFASRTFVWAVCLDPDGESPVTDDVFDLLPGIPYEIRWPEDRPLPTVKRWANWK